MKKSLFVLCAFAAAALCAAPAIPKTISEHKMADGDEITADITASVTEPSTFEFRVFKGGGKDKVAINSVAILENDQQIAVDAHRGTSGILQNNTIYLVSLPAVKSGATYKMVAKVEPIGERDCLAKVVMTKMPLMKEAGKWDKDVILDGGEDDITALVPKSGKFVILYRYTNGPHAAEITEAKVMEDGKEVAKDAHKGITDSSNRNNSYKFAIPYKEGAKYTLETSYKTKNDKGGAVNSNGIIWIAEDK